MNIVSLLGRQKDRFAATDTGVFSPTIALALHAHVLGATALRILYEPAQQKDVEIVQGAIGRLVPGLTVHADKLAQHDAFDPVSASTALMDVVSQWDQDEAYAFSLGTGSHVHMYLWFKLVEAAYLNATLLQVVNTKKGAVSPLANGGQLFFAGRVTVMDMRLSRYEDIERRLMANLEDDSQFLKNGISTLNPQYNALIALIEQVGIRSDYPLLLTGQSGSGKTALAKRIYQLKRDRNTVKGGWVALNCATLTESHAMSVLFGHNKGAFTGAIASRDGLLAKARGGVLFLDEIGCLPHQVQSMLLHALETGEYYPMGSDTPSKSVFTLICGTNEDLAASVDEGLFREDLLARLDTWHFQLPGLAQRKEDIAPNVDFELRRLREEDGQRVKFTPAARKVFLDFATSVDAVWKRNFRDLRSALIRMATLSESGVITEVVVEQEVTRLTQQWQGVKVQSATQVPAQFKTTLPYIDYQTLCAVVEVCGRCARLTDAAKILYQNGDGEINGTNPASRLKNYLAKMSLSFETIKAW